MAPDNKLHGTQMDPYAIEVAFRKLCFAFGLLIYVLPRYPTSHFICESSSQLFVKCRVINPSKEGVANKGPIATHFVHRPTLPNFGPIWGLSNGSLHNSISRAERWSIIPTQCLLPPALHLPHPEPNRPSQSVGLMNGLAIMD